MPREPMLVEKITTYRRRRKFRLLFAVLRPASFEDELPVFGMFCDIFLFLFVDLFLFSFQILQASFVCRRRLGDRFELLYLVFKLCRSTDKSAVCSRRPDAIVPLVSFFTRANSRAFARSALFYCSGMVSERAMTVPCPLAFFSSFFR